MSTSLQRVVFAPNNFRLFKSHIPVARRLAEAGAEIVVLDVAGTRTDEFPEPDQFDFPLRFCALDQCVPPYQGERFWRRRGIERQAHVRICEEAEETLVRLEPDVLVLTNNQGYPHFLLAATARRLRIPVAIVQPGVILPEKDRAASRPFTQSLRKSLLRLAVRAHATVAAGFDRLAGRPHYPLGGVPCFGAGPADVVTVIGRHYLEQFTAEGLDPGKVVVTGNPLYDSSIGGDDLARWPEVAAELGIDPGETVVVFTSQPNVELGIETREERAATLETVISAVSAVDCVDRLVVKLHPLEREADYSGFTSNQVVVTKTAELYPLLSGAACVVTQFSSTGLEAVLLGTGLISIDCTGRPMFDLYLRLGLGDHVRTQDELARALTERLADNPNRETLLQADRARAADLVDLSADATLRVIQALAKAANCESIACD